MSKFSLISENETFRQNSNTHYNKIGLPFLSIKVTHKIPNGQ